MKGSIRNRLAAKIKQVSNEAKTEPAHAYGRVLFNVVEVVALAKVCCAIAGETAASGRAGALESAPAAPTTKPAPTPSTATRVAIDGLAPSSRTAVEALADSYRGLPSAQRPATVAQLETAAGSFGGRAGYSGGMHPVVQELVNANPGKFSRACAECDALSQALRAAEAPTGQPITTVQQAQQTLSGSSIRTARVRGPSSPNHGTPLAPCDSCQPLLDALGIQYR